MMYANQGVIMPSQGNSAAPQQHVNRRSSSYSSSFNKSMQLSRLKYKMLDKAYNLRMISNMHSSTQYMGGYVNSGYLQAKLLQQNESIQSRGGGKRGKGAHGNAANMYITKRAKNKRAVVHNENDPKLDSNNINE